MDTPKTFTICEITIDVITQESSSFLSLLSPTSIHSAELKRRIAAARERSMDNETYRLYYCGQHLRDEDKIPQEVFETGDADALFLPRCKKSIIVFTSVFHICLVIVFIETKQSENNDEDVMHLTKGRYTGSSYHWKSFQSEKQGLHGSLSSSKLQTNISTDVLKNHFQLEEELIKIHCEQYIPALIQAGFLKDEVETYINF